VCVCDNGDNVHNMWTQLRVCGCARAWVCMCASCEFVHCSHLESTAPPHAQRCQLQYLSHTRIQPCRQAPAEDPKTRVSARSDATIYAARHVNTTSLRWVAARSLGRQRRGVARRSCRVSSGWVHFARGKNRGSVSRGVGLLYSGSTSVDICRSTSVEIY